MTIIRTRADIPAASTTDLVESYNAYTGKEIKKFSSREAGEAQLARAIMSAEDASGKMGVKKGQKPVAMTLAELDAARAAKALTGVAQAATDGIAAEIAADKSKGRGLRASLKAKVSGEPNKPKDKPAKKEAGEPRAAKVLLVQLTNAGRSEMQAASQRKAVFDAIVGAAKATAANPVGKPVDIEVLQESFHSVIRGHVLKLIFEGHLVSVEPAAKG